MAWTNWGFDGTINEAQWAELAPLLGNGYVAKDASSCVTTPVSGARKVSVSAGTLFGDGIVSVSDAAEEVTLTTPANGQWYIIALKRTWATNVVGFVAVAGATTTTTTPTAPPSTFPTLLNNPGVETEQPIAWAWCNSANTTVVVYDLRKYPIHLSYTSESATVGAGGITTTGNIDATDVISDNATVSGNVRLTNTADITLSSTNHAFQIGNSTGQNLRLDTDEIQSVNNGSASSLYVNSEGGNIVIGNALSFVTMNGRWLSTHYPYAVATGNANITVSGSNQGTTTVTFPVGRFSVAPVVTTNMNASSGVSQTSNSRAFGITTTGCTLATYTGNGGVTTSTHNVQYIAIQM